ncbi:MAG: methyltransferase domain-containing protein [Lysobacteraceae bacterium]
MSDTTIRKLALGSGGIRFPGWIHVDIDPQWQPEVVADMRQPLPFPDAYADFIHSEDMVEQLTLPEAEAFFRECHRVLKPGGVFRLLTIDLHRLMSMYVQGDLRLRELWEREVPEIPLRQRTLGEVVNLAMLFSNHHFVYDEQSLRAAMEPAGFRLQRVDYRESQWPELRGLDVRSPQNAVSMYFDCEKL